MRFYYQFSAFILRILINFAKVNWLQSIFVLLVSFNLLPPWATFIAISMSIKDVFINMGNLFINSKNSKRMKNKSYKLKQLNGVWNTVEALWSKTDTLYEWGEPNIRSRCVPHPHRQNIIICNNIPSLSWFYWQTLLYIYRHKKSIKWCT